MSKLKIEMKKVSELKPHPQNVRVHGDKQIQELAKSIEMFGVIRPAVIDENGTILTGHGLVDAIKLLGRDEVETYTAVGLTETQKKKLMLADNRIYALGFDDYDNIDDILSEIEDFDIPGFDEDDLNQLYGDIGLEEVNEQYLLPEDEREERQDKFEKHSEGVVVPSNIQAQRETAEKHAENTKFVICHNCGTKIIVDEN